MAEGLHLGTTPWRNASAANALELGEQAALVERIGYESVWLPESHFAGLGGDGAIPDPLMILAAVASRTERIRLGTTSFLLPLRHPLQAAEQVAVLDRLSSGRVILGVGRGYRADLFAAFGVSRKDKRQIFEAVLETMKRAWAGEPVTEEDDEAARAAPPVVLSPLPVQKPHPPILLGVFDSRVGRARVARRGNGWIPIAFDLALTRRSISDVRERMKAEGRDPDQLTTSILYLPSETGEDTVREALDCGADRVILRVPTEDETTVLAFMDRFQEFTGL